MHRMLTRAPGPAWVKGWVCAEPHEGHGGRTGTSRSGTGSPGSFVGTISPRSPSFLRSRPASWHRRRQPTRGPRWPPGSSGTFGSAWIGSERAPRSSRAEAAQLPSA